MTKTDNEAKRKQRKKGNENGFFVDVDFPEIDIDFPDIDIKLPDIDIELPEVDKELEKLSGVY